MTQEERIRKKVDQCIDNYADQCGDAFRLQALRNRFHIINIGTSILNTKWGVGFPGGSFVQAVVDNDLREAFGRADTVNQDCIKFYIMIIHNTGYID